MNISLTFHSDPSHGWLAVPMKMLREMGIHKLISSYSYMSLDGKMAYLEEDCDAGVFLDATEHNVKFVEKHTNYQSPIRNLKPFEVMK